MNQILDYNPISDGENRGNSGNSRNSGGTDKIIKVFAILLIIFAICLIGIGVYNKIKNNTGVNNGDVVQEKASINTTPEGTSLTISISHNKDLTKLIYNWNTTSEKTLSIDSGNTFETIIDIPAGNNTLNIQVVDINGEVTQYSEEISSETGIDIIEPVITDLKNSITDDKKLMINVKDETELSYITYRWNDEEEITINAEEGQLQIKEKIEIREGTNTLTVVAVDKANNTSSVQESFTGLLQPNIQVVLSEDKSKLIVTCTHENGISKIEYTLNDKPFAAQLPDSPKEVTFEQALDEGYNKIILTATSIDNTTTTFGGECTYIPDQSGITIE